VEFFQSTTITITPAINADAIGREFRNIYIESKINCDTNEGG